MQVGLPSAVPVPKLPFWLVAILTAFPLTGLVGMDHFAIGSPTTGVLKAFFNLLTFGGWQIHDILEIVESSKVVEEGQDVPFFGPSKIGVGRISSGQAGTDPLAENWMSILVGGGCLLAFGGLFYASKIEAIQGPSSQAVLAFAVAVLGFGMFKIGSGLQGIVTSMFSAVKLSISSAIPSLPTGIPLPGVSPAPTAAASAPTAASIPGMPSMPGLSLPGLTLGGSTLPPPPPPTQSGGGGVEVPSLDTLIQEIQSPSVQAGGSKKPRESKGTVELAFLGILGVLSLAGFTLSSIRTKELLRLKEHLPKKEQE